MNIEALPDDIIIWEIYYRVHRMYMLDMGLEIFEGAVNYWENYDDTHDSDYIMPSSSDESSDSDYSFVTDSDSD